MGDSGHHEVGWGTQPGLASQPSSYISPQARCFGLPVSPELRGVILAAAVKCFLLALGLALACGFQAAYIPQMAEDLDIRKVAGMWHTVAVVASDMLLLDAKSGPLRVYVEELKPTPEGDLEILLRKRKNHKCVDKTLMAQKTEKQAVFTVNYHGERKISVLDTEYSSYMTFCVEGPTPADGDSVMCQCLAGTPEMDDEAMEKFAGALASLLEHVRMVLDLRQGAEHCHV